MNVPPSASARTRKLALGAIVLLVALLMLPNLVWLAYSHSTMVWVEALAVPIILLVVLFAVLGRALWLACLLVSPFALLAPLETFYVAQYHHPTSAQIIATIVATNPLEAREYFGWMLVPLALALLAACLVAVLAAWWSWRGDLQWRGRVYAWIIAVAIGTPIVSGIVAFASATGSFSARIDASAALLSTPRGQVEPGYPFGVFLRVAEYRSEWDAMRANAEKFKAFRFHARRVEPPLRQRQVYVLVIGESSRRSDWQLFGYDRPTNPELSRLKNLVPLPRLITSWPESLAAIPMILTRRKPAMKWSAPWHEASILRAMQEAGYETYWISNQQAIGEFDSPVSIYAYEAKHVRWLNRASWTAPGSYDEDLVQPLRDALHASQHDLFVVLHMMGSHLKYDYRYPHAFEKWRPVQTSPPGAGTRIERARNSYDNTILYTDHVLAQIIAVLTQSDAVTALWYESDHGEALPTATCDRTGHGVGTWQEFEIPALFWYSNGYARDFPQRVATLRANADQRTVSANTFESLVDMAGVAFPTHDETWSLFSSSWQYHPRIVTQFWRTDFDHSMIGKNCGIVMPADPSSDPH